MSILHNRLRHVFYEAIVTIGTDPRDGRRIDCARGSLATLYAPLEEPAVVKHNGPAFTVIGLLIDPLVVLTAKPEMLLDPLFDV